MTTPGSDPGETVPPDPVVTPEEAAAQAAQQAAAEAAAALNNQIRELAAEIAKQTMMSFDPCTLRKGIVVSVQNTATPPTLTVTISGDTLEIPGVVYYEHYDPQAGDVVHLIKQGTDLAAIGKVAEQHTETAFVDVGLSGGFTHNGNSNGNFKIRRVWDHGVWRVDLQGAVARSSGTTIATGLDAKYRPTSATRRTIIAARNESGGSNSVKVDFGSDGSVTMVGGTTTGATDGAGTTSDDGFHAHAGITGDSGFHSHGGSTNQAGFHAHGGATNEAGFHAHSGSTAGVNSGSAGSSAHTHGISSVGHHTHSIDSVGDHGHSINQVNDHNHSIGSVGDHHHTGGGSDHTHGVTDPTWISFNSQSYFL